MTLGVIDTVDMISPEAFKRDYYYPRKPLIIRNIAKKWPAYTKWNWDYFKQILGDVQVGVYNNVKSDAYTPINKADGYMTFGEYIDLVRKGPVELRIFAFNLLKYAPQMKKDVVHPDAYLPRQLKIYPLLFIGGAGSITHMHFDIDFPNLWHTQFAGRKRVLLVPFTERYKLYRKPFEVLSIADYSHYYNGLDEEKFPALKYVHGYDVTMEPGDTLYMPSGYFHHMEYVDAGFAHTIRALDHNPLTVVKGFWNVTGMRYIDNIMKSALPHPWYNWKMKKIQKRAEEEIQKFNSSF